MTLRYRKHLFCKMFKKDGFGELHVHSLIPPVGFLNRLKPRQILYRSLQGDWFELPKTDTEVSSILAAGSDAMVVARLLDRELAW